MGSKEKLSECLGWLAVALAQYVKEYGLPYCFKVDQFLDGEAIRIRMFNYTYMFEAGRQFSTDCILSLKDPIECLRMELIGMHNELSGGE